jgi:endonuclease/exonuclease/phosphatase family metal-dependent hydrolase
MAKPSRSVTTGGFWRCQKCGTPNPARDYVTNCLGCGTRRPAAPAQGPRAEPAAKATTAPAQNVSARVIISPVRGRYLLAASWAYAAVVIVTLGLIRLVGDAWWGVTLLLFMPRWLFLGPVAALAVASGLWRCRSHWLLQGVTGLVVAGPLMWVSLPVQRLWERPPDGETIRVVTFNLRAGGPLRFGELKRWLDRYRVDVVCFQESSRDDPGIQRYLLSEGWYVSQRGLVASRLPVALEYPEYPLEARDGRRYTSLIDRVLVRSPGGIEFAVASVHLPTVREGLEEFLANGDTAGLARHTAWWSRETSRVLSALAEVGDVPVLVGGDFNMPADDSTMAALRGTFAFAFEEAGWGYGYTKPTRMPWVRIDHILTGPEWYVTRCKVGPNFGSDHLPLIAEAILTRPRPAEKAAPQGP